MDFQIHLHSAKMHVRWIVSPQLSVGVCGAVLEYEGIEYRIDSIQLFSFLLFSHVYLQ